MAFSLLMDSVTTGEVLTATTSAGKLAALKAAMGTGTQTVSIKDNSAVEKLTGTFSGSLYNSGSATFLPTTVLSSVSGAGGTAAADWTCRVTSGSRWFQGEFAEIWTASATLASSGTTTIALTLPYTASGGAPATPPAAVSSWMVRSTDTAVSVPSYLIGMHAHRYPDNSAYIPTPSPAFTYSFGSFRVHDYEYTKWSDIHTSNGNFSWTALDAVIDFHAAAGRKIKYTVSSTPPWAADTSYTTSFGVVGGAGGVGSQADLSSFITALVTRYNTDSVRDNGGLKKITWLECWNEPDYFPYTANIFFKDTAATLAEMCRTMYQAAKAVDSTITVLSPGIVDTAYTDQSSGYSMDPEPEPNKCSKLADASDNNAGTGKLWHEELAWHWYDYQPPTNAAINALKLNKLITSMRTVHTDAGYSATLPMHITEIAGWGWSETTPSDANKVLWIQRTASIAAARGIKTVDYYAHEDVNYLGAPATNATIAAGITSAHSALANKTIRQAAILSTNQVWIEFTDGTQVLDCAEYP